MIWTFASRYFFGKKSTQAVNIISWVSVLAIAVGAASLIIVLSVFNGFEDLVKSLYSSFYPELKVSPASGKTFLITGEDLRQLHRMPQIRAVSQALEAKAVLLYNGQRVIAEVMGVDSNYTRVSGLEQKLVRGRYATGTVQVPDAIVGAGIDDALGLDLRRNFIPITVYVPRRNIQTLALPEDAFQIGEIYPSAVFAIQQDFDNKYLITNLEFLRTLTGYSDSAVSHLDIALLRSADMSAVQKRLQQLLGDRVIVQTRYEQNRSLFMIMQTEKWAVYAILSFIFVIAAFNMIGSMTMLVIEKRRDISILKAMGARKTLIYRIFLAEGLLVAGFGSAIGTILAVVICAGQMKFGWVKLAGGSFVIDRYPVSMHASDFLLVWLTILLITLLASWYPARRAARQAADLKSE